jgi:hypothetical protein
VRLTAAVAVVAVLALTGAATAAAPFVLPKPGFPPPPSGPGSNTVHFQILSSMPADPARSVAAPRPRNARIEGTDGTTRHVVVALGQTFDFRNYAWPPRVAPGEREFAYEQVVYANRSQAGVLYVETAHQTYAKSTYGLNGYLNAIGPRQRQLLWRSPAQVANAQNFVLLDETVVTGYGFTAEPDYLYAIDRATGRVKGRVILPSAPQRIARHGNVLTVDTYDHRVTVRVIGG